MMDIIYDDDGINEKYMVQMKRNSNLLSKNLTDLVKKSLNEIK